MSSAITETQPRPAPLFGLFTTWRRREPALEKEREGRGRGDTGGGTREGEGERESREEREKGEGVKRWKSG